MTGELGRWRAWGARATLAGAALVGLVPIAGLVHLAGSDSTFSIGSLVESFRGALGDPRLGGALVVGASGGLLGLLIGSGLHGSGIGRAGRSLLQTVPPLVIGLGAIQAAALIGRTWPSLGGTLGAAGPRWWALGPTILAVGLVLGPWGRIGLAQARAGLPRPAAEAAVALGVGRFRRLGTAARLMAPPLALALAVMVALAAVGLTPAVVTRPPGDRRPLGLLALEQREADGRGLREAARVGLLILLAGLAVTPVLAGLQREADADLPRG